LPTQQRAVETRKAVLLATAKVFDEHGYDSATIAQILAEAGVTKGAMYFHFSSKHELALGVIRAQSEWLESLLDQAEVSCQQMVDVCYEFSRALREDPLIRASVRLSVERGSFRGEGGPMYQMWSQATAHVLEELRREGFLRDTVDIPRTAILVPSAMTGLQLTSEALTARKDLDEQIQNLWELLAPSLFTDECLKTLDLRPPAQR